MKIKNFKNYIKENKRGLYILTWNPMKNILQTTGGNEKQNRKVKLKGGEEELKRFIGRVFRDYESKKKKEIIDDLFNKNEFYGNEKIITDLNAAIDVEY